MFYTNVARGKQSTTSADGKTKCSLIAKRYYSTPHVPADSQLENTTNFIFDSSVLQSIIRQH